MSAFVVNKAHINAMVHAGLQVQYKPMHWYPKSKEGSSSLTELNASEIGQMLLDECVKSVCYRYGGSEVTDLPGRTDAEWLIPFQYKVLFNPPSPVEVLKIIACYGYQSCEHPEWEDSEAKCFCDRLRKATITRLPGYEEAPWEWTKVEPEKMLEK